MSYKSQDVYSSEVKYDGSVDTVKLQTKLPSTGVLENKLIDQGLVNIQSVDSTVKVNLKYSCSENFLGTDVYGELEHCYLQKDVAEKLAKAQQYLKEKYPYYSLLLLDGARPLSLQKIMWDTIHAPVKEKIKFLSNPVHGSLHNYGAAVDITIVNEDGTELDMGTSFDYMGELAYPIAESRMYKTGKLSWRQIENRKLLREVMQKSGFFNIPTEWWHFNACSRAAAAEKYQLIE